MVAIVQQHGGGGVLEHPEHPSGYATVNGLHFNTHMVFPSIATLLFKEIG